MKQTGQEARLNYIVEELKKDSGSCRDMEVRPRDRRRVMRSLMNIRMPGPLPAGFLEIQDEFLREEAREKGIVSLADIPTVKEQYGSGVLFGDRISNGRAILHGCRQMPLSTRPIPVCWGALCHATAVLTMPFIPLRD